MEALKARAAVSRRAVVAVAATTAAAVAGLAATGNPTVAVVAAEAAGHRTPSAAQKTSTCGKGGKMQRPTVSSSSAGSQKNLAAPFNGFANREAVFLSRLHSRASFRCVTFK
jgi:hypothetical protein